MKKTYYLGTLPGNWGGYDKGKDTLILQAREDKDFLSCELEKYIGPRIITKKQLHADKAAILRAYNCTYETDYRQIIID